MLSFQPNCYSEHDELKIVMLCAPSVLDVPDLKTAEDVQWSGPVQVKKALEAHGELRNILEDAGIQVIDYSEKLSPAEARLNEQLLNRVFVRDLACVFGNIVLPGNAGTSIRRPEYAQVHALMENWFSCETFLTEKKAEMNALEYGDVLVLNKDAVFINVGMRTSVESVHTVKDILLKQGFSEIGLIDLPRRGDTMHLDMNCNVVNKDLLVSKSFVRYFPLNVLTEKGSRFEMPEEFLKRHGFDIYWLQEYDTIPDINFLNIDPETILISKQAHKQMLKKHHKLANKRFIEAEVSELEKGGGGVRCMTMPIRRN